MESAWPIVGKLLVDFQLLLSALRMTIWTKSSQRSTRQGSHVAFFRGISTDECCVSIRSQSALGRALEWSVRLHTWTYSADEQGWVLCNPFFFDRFIRLARESRSK